MEHGLTENDGIERIEEILWAVRETCIQYCQMVS